MCETERKPPGEISSPGRLWRNGMDYEPKKTYPPDYSNVPTVRDWQMSPFGNARYDLDELQRAEKRGFKGRFELEMLKKKYGIIPPDPEEPAPPPVHPKKCKKGFKKKEPCSTELLYQPYGPTPMSTMSYNRPDLTKPRVYSYMGPSFYSGFRFKVPAPQMVSITPCSDSLSRAMNAWKYNYIPYGPYGEIRLTPDQYVPMGPSIEPIHF